MQILLNFTCLETLTIVSNIIRPTLQEIDGEMSFQELMFGEAEALESQLRRYRWLIKKLKESMKDEPWNTPIVRIRARQQLEDFDW